MWRIKVIDWFSAGHQLRGYQGKCEALHGHRFKVVVKVESAEIDKTGMVYDSYVEMCKNYGLKPLTQRRVSDLISEFQTFGILNTVVVSHGRYGRTRNITLSISETTIKKIEEFLAKEL